MYNYWKSNRNVILTAVALFVVSLTALLYFLTGEPGNEYGGLKANVVDSLSVKTQQEEEKTYRSLLDEYDHEGPLVVIGVDGFVEFASWDFETITGYTLDEMKEELFYSFVHPEDLSLILGASGKVLATESPVVMVGPYRMRDADGEYRLHMASLYPVKKHEKITKIIIAIRDITIDIEESTIQSEQNNSEHKADDKPDDKNRGHGNDTDGNDESNPGKSNDKSIRDVQDDENSRLLVEMLAQLIQ